MGGSVARLQTLRGHRGLAVVGAGAELPARAADPSAVPSPARSPGRPPPPRAHSPVCLPDAPRLPARAPHPAPAPSARGRRAGSESWRGSPGPAPGSARPDRGPVQRAALGPEHHSGACWPADTAAFLPGAGAGALGNPSPPGPRDHLGARVPLGGRGARGGRPLHPSRPWPGGLLPFIFFFIFWLRVVFSPTPSEPTGRCGPLFIFGATGLLFRGRRGKGRRTQRWRGAPGVAGGPAPALCPGCSSGQAPGERGMHSPERAGESGASEHRESQSVFWTQLKKFGVRAAGWGVIEPSRCCSCEQNPQGGSMDSSFHLIFFFLLFGQLGGIGFMYSYPMLFEGIYRWQGFFHIKGALH